MLEQEVLQEKTRDYLKAGLVHLFHAEQSVRVMVDERVPPTAGEEFIGVYGAKSENLNPPTAITKRIEHGLTIGITRRASGIANENAGEEILTQNQIIRIKPSLLKRADEIIRLMLAADGWTLISQVNTIVAPSGGCFVTPLGLANVAPKPETVDAEHWDQEQDENTFRYAGLFLELEFAGAEYYQVSQPPS